MLKYLWTVLIAGLFMSPTDGLSCSVNTSWPTNTLEGAFTSPNYPQNYTNSQSCRWSFVTNDSYQVVVIKITDLLVLKGPFCTTTHCVSNVSSKCKDYMTLQEKGNAGRQLFVCGDSPPSTCFVLKHVTTQVQNTDGITSVCRGNITYVDTINPPNNIHFYSNNGSTRKGFRLKFNVVNVTASSTTNNFSTSQTQPTTTTTKITTNETKTTETTKPDSDTSSIGEIIGSIVGVILVSLLVFVFLFYFRHKKKQKPPEHSPDEPRISSQPTYVNQSNLRSHDVIYVNNNAAAESNDSNYEQQMLRTERNKEPEYITF